MSWIDDLISLFPYTDFHRLNADWILKTVKQMFNLTKTAQEAAETSAETVETYETRLQAVETVADGAVRFDAAQNLTNPQKTQARNNIGAADANSIPTDFVRYGAAQSLSDPQKEQARNNIGAADGATVDSIGEALANTRTTANLAYGLASHAVLTEENQGLDSTEQANARNNIGAAASSDVPTDAVRYSAQSGFTAEQKQQARTNIDAAAQSLFTTFLPANYVRYTAVQSLTTAQKNQARNNIGAISGESPTINTPTVNSTITLNEDGGGAIASDEIQIAPQSVTDHSILHLEGEQSTLVRVSGVAAPVENDQAANKDYVDDAIAALPEFVHVVYTISGTVPNLSATCNLTLSQILSAINANKHLLIDANWNSYPVKAGNLSYMMFDNGWITAAANCYDPLGEDTAYYINVIHDSDSISIVWREL